MGALTNSTQFKKTLADKTATLVNVLTKSEKPTKELVVKTAVMIEEQRSALVSMAYTHGDVLTRTEMATLFEAYGSLTLSYNKLING